MIENTYDKLMALRRMPDAYEQWAGYRQCLTEYIIQTTKAGTSAMVLGAGSCNDLDLNELAGHFSQLELVDIDREAVEAGLKRQMFSDTTEGNIKISQTDLAGIPAELYRKLCLEIESEIRKEAKGRKTGGDSEIGDKIFDKYLNRGKVLIERKEPAGGLSECGKADYVVCCGVHSQLNNIFPQLAELYSRYIHLDTERIFAYASGMNRIIAGHLNRNAVGLARKGIILGLETERLGIPGGVEGAAQAIEDIGRQTAMKGWKVLEKEAVWPFSIEQGKIYKMKLMNISFE